MVKNQSYVFAADETGTKDWERLNPQTKATDIEMDLSVCSAEV